MRVLLRATSVETLAIVVTPRRGRKAATPAPAPTATKAAAPSAPRPANTAVSTQGRPGLGAEPTGANR